MQINANIQTADFIGAILTVSSAVTSVYVVDAFTTSAFELITMRTSYHPAGSI